MEPAMKNKKNLRSSTDLSIDFYGDLQKNPVFKSIIDSGKGLRAIEYKKNLALLLFIDKKRRLRLVTQNSQSPADWSSYILSGKRCSVSTFDSHYNTTRNALKIAYSTDRSSSSELMLSAEVSLNSKPTAFLKNFTWQKVDIGNVPGQINFISMNESGLLFSTGSRIQDATYSYFRYGENPQKFNLPENSPKVIQLKVGQFDGDFGCFLLYEMKRERTLLFQGFPDPYGEFYQRRFAISGTPHGFTTVCGRNGDDRLYVCGDGISSFSEEGARSTVCSDKSITFSRIETVFGHGEAAIWAIGKSKGKSGLYHLSGKLQERNVQTEALKWSPPRRLQGAIEEYSIVEGSSFASQLFLLGSDENPDDLIRYWQDRGTTSWRQDPIYLQDLEELEELYSFGVKAQFKSISGSAQPALKGHSVSVSAERRLLLYIERKKVEIAPKKSYSFTLNDDYFEIAYRTSDIAPEKLYIEADFLPKKRIMTPEDVRRPVRFSDFIILGTHDSASSMEYVPTGTGLSDKVIRGHLCQTATIPDQFDLGVRFFDLRINSDLSLIHADNLLEFGHLKDTLEELNSKARSENTFAIISLKLDKGSLSKDRKAELKKMLKGCKQLNNDKQWNISGMYILNRIEELSGFKYVDFTTDGYTTIETTGEHGTTEELYVQDAYSFTNLFGAWKEKRKSINKCDEKSFKGIKINFTSFVNNLNPDPLIISDDINEWLRDREAKYFRSNIYAVDNVGKRLASKFAGLKGYLC